MLKDVEAMDRKVSNEEHTSNFELKALKIMFGCDCGPGWLKIAINNVDEKKIDILGKNVKNWIMLNTCNCELCQDVILVSSFLS